MILSALQKQITLSIVKKEIASVADFVEKFIKHKKGQSDTNYSPPQLGVGIGTKDTVCIVEEGQYEKFVELRILIDYLKEENFIYIHYRTQIQKEVYNLFSCKWEV